MVILTYWKSIPDVISYVEWTCTYTDRKNVTNFLYLVLHWACKVTCYYQLVSSVLFSVLRTSTNVLSKSKSRNCVTWIPNVTKLFLSVYGWFLIRVQKRHNPPNNANVMSFKHNYVHVCKFYSTFCYSKNILARWRSIFLSWAENSDILNFVEKKSM